MLSLVEIIKVIFKDLTDKIDTRLNTFNLPPTPACLKPPRSDVGEDERYQDLEKILQKHEAEIRTHIRVEQQLKLYAESLQQKYETSESTRIELVANTKTMILDLKRGSEGISDKCAALEKENERIKKDNERLNSELASTLDSKSKIQMYKDTIQSLEEKIKGNRSSSRQASRERKRKPEYDHKKRRLSN